MTPSTSLDRDELDRIAAGWSLLPWPPRLFPIWPEPPSTLWAVPLAPGEDPTTR